MNSLGILMFSGLASSPNEEEAAKWFRSAAEKGNPAAACNLGFCYSTGRGVKLDVAEAARWYRKAAETGLAKAQFALGLACLTGWVPFSGTQEARDWIAKAASQGYAPAECWHGLFLRQGDLPKGVEPDEEKAFALIRKSAEQGDSRGQYELGLSYKEGRGTRKDPVEAARLFELSALQESSGSADAQADLGYLFLTGTGVPKDPAKGRRLLDLSIANKSGRGSSLLGDWMRQDAGKDGETRSVSLYREAAQAGDAAGAFRMGCLQWTGLMGVPKDEAAAIKSLMRATFQNHLGARFLLGAILLTRPPASNNAASGERLLVQSGLATGGLQAKEEVARAWYQAHLDQFKVPLTYDVRILRLAAAPEGKASGRTQAELKARTREIQKALAAKTPFEDLVEKYSDDPKKGQSRGLFQGLKPGALPAALDLLAQNVTIGAVSKPQVFADGVVFLRVEKRVPAHLATFEEVKGTATLQATAEEALARLRQSPWGDFIQEQL